MAYPTSHLYVGTMTDLDDQECTYYANRAAAYLALKQHRLALADCQCSIMLNSAVPPPKLFVRLGRCYYALGEPLDALGALGQALSLDSDNELAMAFQTKASKLQKSIEQFATARSRNQWRVAEGAHACCIATIDDEKGEVPVLWRCWGVEVEIARGRLGNAEALVKCVSITFRVNLLM